MRTDPAIPSGDVDGPGGSPSTLRPRAPLPSVQLLVDAAVADCHPVVQGWASAVARRQAWQEQLRWSLEVAAVDLEYARGFQRLQPHSGAALHAYLDTWIGITEDLHVLAGPRYRDCNPHRPFVGISGSNRPLSPDDVPGLTTVVSDAFGVFAPQYVLLWSSSAAHSWPGTGNDTRLLAAPLGLLRRSPLDARLAAHPVTETSPVSSPSSAYVRYLDLHRHDRRTGSADWTPRRPYDAADFNQLARTGLLWDVTHNGAWVGLVAARPKTFCGLTGIDVDLLMLAPSARGHGLGSQLTRLIARQVPHPNRGILFGTIHHTNTPAYRAAIRAGRIDVGGEITLPVR